VWFAWQILPRRQRLAIAGWLGWIVLVTLALLQPLTTLMVHAAQSELHSYIPLVPLVVGGLLYLRRKNLPREYRRSIAPTLVMCIIGLAALVASVRAGDMLSSNDRLALVGFAYVCVVAGGGFLFLGSSWMATAAFPMTFLLFMVPLPDLLVQRIETASVLASAEVSAWFFTLTGTPLLRDGNTFSLPGIVLLIAQQCSGIHSSWVLLMTSLLASNLLLESPWRRLALVTFMIPLAIVRNSVRILVIGLLCVHIGPHMIDSYIHRHGGPVFFALSLIPMLALLMWLRRQEQ
jgi:exosortase C (VPDSG-CTERM-specific)